MKRQVSLSSEKIQSNSSNNSAAAGFHEKIVQPPPTENNSTIISVSGSSATACKFSRIEPSTTSLFLSPQPPATNMKLFKDFEDIMAEEQRRRKIWKVVLTGGPCGGKTTGQTRLATFFENLGWKVYRVPETANILLSGGVNFGELDERAQEEFQVSEKNFFLSDINFAYLGIFYNLCQKGTNFVRICKLETPLN